MWAQAPSWLSASWWHPVGCVSATGDGKSQQALGFGKGFSRSNYIHELHRPLMKFAEGGHYAFAFSGRHTWVCFGSCVEIRAEETNRSGESESTVISGLLRLKGHV